MSGLSPFALLVGGLGTLEVAMIKEGHLIAVCGLAGLLTFSLELLVLAFELLDAFGLFFELFF